MSIDIFCNGKYYFLDNIPFYRDIVCIKTDIECDKEKNKILIYSSNPRTNIDSLIYCSDFIFNESLGEDSIGQIISRMLLNYNFKCTKHKFEFLDIRIITKGKRITDFIIFMPFNDKTFLRELLFSRCPKQTGYCYICYDEKTNMIHLHRNHSFCMDCLLKWKKKKSPLCREKII